MARPEAPAGGCSPRTPQARSTELEITGRILPESVVPQPLHAARDDPRRSTRDSNYFRDDGRPRDSGPIAENQGPHRSAWDRGQCPPNQAASSAGKAGIEGNRFEPRGWGLGHAAYKRAEREESNCRPNGERARDSAARTEGAVARAASPRDPFRERRLRRRRTEPRRQFPGKRPNVAATTTQTFRLLINAERQCR